MKLLSFLNAAAGKTALPRLGVLANDSSIIDVAADAGLPPSMAALLNNPASLETIKRSLPSLPRLRFGEIRLCPPLPRPAKNIMCVGKNYHAHAKEFQSSGFDATASADAIPKDPIIFTKPLTTISADGDPIPATSDETNSVDYEGELVVVIGRGGRAIPREKALSHVFGYTLANDVTSRVTQSKHKQWFLGKSLDGFCPMGPVIVTADEIPDPSKLRLQTMVNGEIRQNACVADLIFDIPFLIETISKLMTLDAGDLIATGTPEGVGIGFNPPRYLKAGDEVQITIAEIGTLTNPVN